MSLPWKLLGQLRISTGVKQNNGRAYYGLSMLPVSYQGKVPDKTTLWVGVYLTPVMGMLRSINHNKTLN